MEIKSFVSKAQALAGSTVASATATAGKLLDDFNQAMPTMRALGFTVREVHVGMGILPEVGARLVASTDTIDVKTLEELIARHADKTVLVSALKALLAAYNIKQQIPDVPVNGIELDVRLGLPPRVDARFVNDVRVAAA